MDIELIRDAARQRQARAQHWRDLPPEDQRYRGIGDRPRQRRDGEAVTCQARVTVRARSIDLRASEDGSKLIYDGYASVTDAPYEMWDWAGPYTELVTPGAFAKTLAQPDLDVPLVLQHDALRRIARTTNGSLQLEEDDHGLHVLAEELDPADEDVKYIAPKLRSGLIDEMSFKFMITKGKWSPDWMEYHIEEVDLHRGDVAIVAYGANPHTAGSGLRLAPGGLVESWTDEEAREVLRALNGRLGPAKSMVTDEDTRHWVPS